MKLKIELQSDLCAGSGQGYSTVIDTDVIYDNYGLPYIPAKRLKGCLREAAEYIGLSSNKIQEIFGESGQKMNNTGGYGGSLKISNALMEDYEKLVKHIVNNNIPSGKVLSLFTNIRSQTSLKDNGTAEDNSLRFTRVVSQYYNEKNLCFYANIDVNDKDKKELEKAVKALKHIGTKRTRGLGLVKCSLLETGNRKNNFAIKTFPAESTCRLDYTVELKEDVMVSNLNDYKSITYIPGTSVLGALASVYLRNKKAADAAFEDIFLKDVVFGNLYWYGTAPSYPVPSYVGKVKGSDIHMNLLQDFQSQKITLKQEKGKYLDANNQLGEVQLASSYHNSNVSKRLKDSTQDGGLYLNKCIARKQKFGGVIYGKYKHLEVLKDLLLNNNLRFGKSKTAQYSECILSSIGIDEVKQSTLRVEQNQKFCVILRSDLALINQYGCYTSDLSDLTEHIDERLNKAGKIKLIKEKTILSGNTIGGYSGIWNLKKSQIDVFGAGSVLTFEALQQLDLPAEILLGDKNNEGFGVCIISFADQLALPQGVYKQPKEQGSEESLKIFRTMDSAEKLKARAYEYAEKNKHNFNALTSSNISRILLMINKSSDYENFYQMVCAIKTESVKKTAEKLIQEYKDSNYQIFYKTVFTYAKNYKKIRGDQ